ncbi:MAG: C10 family peptidase [Bacteroidales bacterium]|nr:C10 family peptidase [Bacteroidales bacterium]
MKKFFVSLLFVGLAALSVASPVDYNRAQAVAIKAAYLFYIHQHPAMQKQDIYMETGFNWSINQHYDNIYLFNIEYSVGGKVVDNGFVVVSGETFAAPILAFSTEGKINGEEINPAPGARAMFARYDQQIAAAKAQGAQPTATIQAKWDMIESLQTVDDATALMSKGDIYNDDIPRLLGNMRWGQGKPYNTHCPGNAVTGCVATAFSMIMNYWNWPEHGWGSHSYNGADNPAVYGNWTYGVQSADFGSTYYDWDHMPDYVMINSPEEEIEAVSTLCYHVGVALDMNYNPNGSGCWSLPEYAIFDTSLHLATTVGADYRIPKHFGYKYSYAGMRDSIGNDSIWLNMLYTSLAEGKPIYYAGWAKENNEAGHSATSGHGYVLDGYFSDATDSNFFHINWGWNGSSDGFFKLDAMTPSGSDFTQWHGAIIGLEPDSTYTGYNPEGIREQQQPNYTVNCHGGRVVVQGCAQQPVAIFDIMGRLVDQRAATANDRWSLAAPRGTYIVRVGMQPAQKVVNIY